MSNLTNFAPIHDQYMYEPLDIQYDIERTFKKPDNEESKKILTMKECILDIINGKCEMPYDALSEDSKKYVDENKEIVSKIKRSFQLFSKLQKELYDIDEEYKTEIKDIKKKLETMDTMISFLRKLPEEVTKDERMKDIIDKMNNIGENIKNNQKITDIKKRYAEKRTELNSHLDLMNLLNDGNHSNMCAICLEKTVDHYANPCGHTACQECFDKNKQEIVINETMPQSDINYKCPFCRNVITSLKPIFFL